LNVVDERGASIGMFRLADILHWSKWPREVS